MSKISKTRKDRLKKIGMVYMKNLRDTGIETFLDDSIEKFASLIDATKEFLNKNHNGKVKYTDRDIVMLFKFIGTTYKKEKSSGK